MSTRRARRGPALALIGAIFLPATVSAQNGAAGAHVRPLTPDLHRLVSQGASHAPTFAALLARLDRSDVVAYVRCGLLPHARGGELRFIGPAGGLRYVEITLRCSTYATSIVSVLGHELHHAAEVADAPWVVDAQTMAALYRAIGHSAEGPDEFETAEAWHAGLLVREELERGRTDYGPLAPADK